MGISMFIIAQNERTAPTLLATPLYGTCRVCQDWMAMTMAMAMAMSWAKWVSYARIHDE